MIRDSYQFARKPQIPPRVPVKGRPERLLDLGRQPSGMHAQISRKQRQDPVMFREPENFAPVECEFLPARNASEATRAWFDASACT